MFKGYRHNKAGHPLALQIHRDEGEERDKEEIAQGGDDGPGTLVRVHRAAAKTAEAQEGTFP